MAVLLGGSSIKSIQRVAGSGSSSASVTISAVDVDKTFVSWVGGGKMGDSTYYARVNNLTSTSVSMYWGGGYNTSQYVHVVEYN
tara:strand:- start:607 stop:858 length:252 start_codon:yes stop_codon:yes gene_type:complete